MTLSPGLEALKAEAMATSCASWAIRKRWVLSKGHEMIGPCPKCGGDDRFGISAVKNVFNCRNEKCDMRGSGVIDLVMKQEGVSFVAACEIITGRTASDPIDEARAEHNRQELARVEAKRKAEAERYREKARLDGHDIWVSGWATAPDGPVAAYLERRGLRVHGHPAVTTIEAMQLREYDALPWVEEFTNSNGYRDFRTLHHGPAMLARIILPARLCRAGDPLGNFGGVHQTWIDLNQPKGRLVLEPNGKIARPTKKMRGRKQGGCIPLYTPKGARRIVMGEGIETTATPLCHAFELHTAYWAGGDVGNMAGKALYEDGVAVLEQPDMAETECFIVPDWCEELVYLVEKDDPKKHTVEKCRRGLRRNQLWREAQRAEQPDLPELLVFEVTTEADGDMNDLVLGGRPDE